MKTKHSRINLSSEQKDAAIKEIKRYFFSERDEEIGDLAAGLLLEFFCEKIGPMVYNQAVFDVQGYLQEKTEEIEGLLL